MDGRRAGPVESVDVQGRMGHIYVNDTAGGSADDETAPDSLHLGTATGGS